MRRLVMVALWTCAACDAGKSIVDRSSADSDVLAVDAVGFKPQDGASGKAEVASADAWCAGRPDGKYCDAGTLITCAAGTAAAALPCPAGCIATPGDLPDVCAVDPSKPLCEGRADGSYCDGAGLVTCAAEQPSGTTPCPLGCLAASSEEPGACADEGGGGLCAAKGDGAWCAGDDLLTCQGGAVVSKAPCAKGCVPAPAGQPSSCANDGADVCAAKGDGAWCAGDDLVACQGGVTTGEVTCLYGCVGSPTGKGSVCGPGGTEAFCAGKANGPHCKGSTLVACADGEILYVNTCPLGCIPGALDICKSAEGQTFCTGQADGTWCDDATLATCKAGQVVGETACAFGCQSGAPGTPGHCAASSFCATVPGKASASPPNGGCNYMDWALESDGYYLASQFGTTNDLASLGTPTSCGTLQKQYDAHGCVFDQQANACLAGDKAITWVKGTVDYSYASVVSAVAANMDGNVPFPQYFYLADAQRFGCGRTLRVSNPVTGKCVVAYTESGGPDSKLESAAYGGRRIASASPAIIQYLGVQHFGWQDADLLYLEWGKPGDTPGQKCTPCESAPAKAGSEGQKSAWDLAHLMPSCGKPVVSGCPAGDGTYCGASIGLDPAVLFQCSGGSFSPQETCAAGCAENPPGTPDACAVGKTQSECPSGDGLYCGGPVGLDGNTLYFCSAGNFAPSQTCAGGCQVNPPGTSDACQGAPAPVSDGKLHMCDPFKPPLPVTCAFGCYSGHMGSDYSAANGTPVYAPIGGVVTKVVNTVNGQTCTPDFGNYVKIQSGEYEVILAHMSKDIPVGKDASIAAGTHVGNVSNTGYTMTLKGGQWVCMQGGGYHLHLETRKNGKAVDAQTTSSIVWDCAGGGAPSGGFCSGKMDGLWCDGNALVTCLGGQVVTSKACPVTCVNMPVGTPDECMDSGAACPSGNGKYCGGSVGKDSSTLYQCTNGSYSVLEVCANGCQVNPAGTEDACKAAAATCPSGNGKYCGGSLGKDGNTLYQCTDGAISIVQVCPDGCQTMPAGTSDQCKAPSSSGCPSGNGLYCGGTLGKDSKTLYNCTDGNTKFAAYCSAGCWQKPAGQSDDCSSGSCPSGNGAYCGQSVGLSSSTLYYCSNGKYTIKQTCGGTCKVAPPGQPDTCP